VLKKLEIRYFFYIGGNDSAETVHIINEAAQQAAYGIRCFHIPKTIDNDLRENDHTPGYGSAARFVACAIKGDDLDNRALGGVKIDVIMGRNAGFLTAAAALARTEADDGPHLIYLPERPFTLEGFVKDVQKAMKKFGRCVIAVSEGIADKDGTPILAKYTKEVDSHGNVQLSGTGALGDLLAGIVKEEVDSHGNVQLSGTGALGDLLAGIVKEKAGIKRVRADTFGYLQRSFPGIASSTDAMEARLVGVAALQAAVCDDISSGSIAIKRKATKKYAVEFEVVPLRSVAKETRHMPDEFINKAGNDVTQAFIDYARPLVGALPKTERFAQLKK